MNSIAYFLTLKEGKTADIETKVKEIKRACNEFRVPVWFPFC